MKNVDIRKVMKRAWEIKKQDKRNIFSFCLKMAWAEAKNLKITILETVKHDLGVDYSITRETEKAVAFTKNTGYSTTLVWLPKSQCATLDGILFGVTKWIAEQKGIYTVEGCERFEKKYMKGMVLC